MEYKQFVLKTKVDLIPNECSKKYMEDKQLGIQTVQIRSTFEKNIGKTNS